MNTPAAFCAPAPADAREEDPPPAVGDQKSGDPGRSLQGGASNSAGGGRALVRPPAASS